MTRFPSLAALALLAGCSGTATTSVATDVQQGAYAAEQAYTVAAHAEVTAGPLLSATDRAQMKTLDERVYGDIKAIRSAGALGKDITALVAAFQADLAPLNTLLGVSK